MSTETTARLSFLHKVTAELIQKMTIAPVFPEPPNYATELARITYVALQNIASTGYRMWELKLRMSAFRENLSKFKVNPAQLQHVKMIEQLVSSYLRNDKEDMRVQLKRILAHKTAQICKWLPLQTTVSILDKDPSCQALSFSSKLNTFFRTAAVMLSPESMAILRKKLSKHEKFKPTPRQLQQIQEVEELIPLCFGDSAKNMRDQMEILIKRKLASAFLWLFPQTKSSTYPVHTDVVLPKDTASDWIASLHNVMTIVNKPYTKDHHKIFKLYKEKMVSLCKQIIKQKDGPHWSLLFHIGLIENQLMEQHKNYIVSLFTLINIEDRDRSKSILGKRKEIAPPEQGECLSTPLPDEEITLFQAADIWLDDSKSSERR